MCKCCESWADEYTVWGLLLVVAWLTMPVVLLVRIKLEVSSELNSFHSFKLIHSPLLQKSVCS